MAPKPTKLTKALKEMKKMGFSEKIVRPIVRSLLSTYDNNWALIEGDEYQVLVDAILDSEDKKTKDSELEQLMNAWSEDEDEEENEPLIKRPKRSDSKKGKSTFFEEHRNKDTSCHGKRKGIVVKQEKGSKVISDDDDDDGDGRDESKSIVPLVDLGSSGDESFDCISEKIMIVYEKGNRKKISKENDLALVEKVNDEHDEAAFEIPLAVVSTQDSPVLLLQGSSQESFSTPKENISLFAEVMDLDAENISPCLLLKEPYSVENSFDMEENHQEESTNNEKIELEKSENGVLDSMNLDIASSSKGEVKISLTISSSLKSGLHIPSLAALFEQVEEHCLESYKIPRTDFSMSKLMTEVCESFLIAGTTSKYNEDVRTETVSAGEIDNQLSLHSNSAVSNDPIKIIQIPKFVGSIGLDLSRCKIYLSETERSIFELSTKTMFLQNHFTSDITNGQESNEISLINEVNEDQCPKFNYISKNVIYQNANVRFSLANISEQNCCSNCFGDCLSLQMPCNCAGKSDSEFAYTPGGVLKESFLDNFVLGNDFVQKHNLFYCQDCPLERPNDTKLSVPCNGHITRKFIKECWIKCRCSFKCGNRVVQRGITAKLQVFMTAERKGWGVRTLEEIPKGAFVCEYVGEVVTTKEQFGRDVRKNSGDLQTYSVLLDAGWSCKGILKDEDALCLDATVYGNVARFINHRCFDANLVDIPVEVETPDHHYYRLAFFTKRKVNALEELTWVSCSHFIRCFIYDYGFDFNDNDFECRCGSKLCRDRKTSKRKLISL
ncbi:hypothetical protein ABFX02_07G052600 [Erythranthe guttata]